MIPLGSTKYTEWHQPWSTSISGSMPSAAMRSITSAWRASSALKAMWLTHTGRPLPRLMALLHPSFSPTPWTSKKAMHVPSPRS